MTRMTPGQVSEACQGSSVGTAGRWEGYSRADGRKGIRNSLLVVYLVECAHHVAAEIAAPFSKRGVELIGFPGCYPSDYAHKVLSRIPTLVQSCWSHWVVRALTGTVSKPKLRHRGG
mgnify:CR=1 FL=1